jgi:hypothetical protein
MCVKTVFKWLNGNALDSGDLQAVPGSERLRIPESRFFVSDSIISSLV